MLEIATILLIDGLDLPRFALGTVPNILLFDLLVLEALDGLRVSMELELIILKSALSIEVGLQVVYY